MFLTKVAKRLAVGPSDKVIYPRKQFGSFPVGSKFSNAIFALNSQVDYDTLFSDKHLDELLDLENTFLNNMARYYTDGILSNGIIRVEEELHVFFIIRNQTNGLVATRKFLISRVPFSIF